MKQGSVAFLLSICVLLVTAGEIRAEVKTEERNQFKLEGAMGRVMGMFGGKAAKEGVVNTVAVKGNRKATTGENTREIIDLDEQKIYELDMKKKNYRVVTFDEMKQRLAEAREQAAKAPQNEKQDSAKQMEFELDLKESGQKRLISGYDCREVVVTITGHEKGKTLEEAGGMVMTSHIWLGPEIAGLKEIQDFDVRYAKALAESFDLGGSAEQMAMATAMFPGMKGMMAKMQTESVNMTGSQLLTETTIETAKNPAQVSQEQEQPKDSDSSSGISSITGGLGGMLGRRMKKKSSEEDAGKPKNRSTILSTSHELLKVEASAPDADFAIPAGFKEKK